MNDHLPECPIRQHADSNWDCPTYCDGDCKTATCICSALRACEQRVRLEDDDYAHVAAQAEAEGRRRGWNEALDAAREAVIRTCHHTRYEGSPPCLHDTAAAAIATLRFDSSRDQ